MRHFRFTGLIEKISEQHLSKQKQNKIVATFCILVCCTGDFLSASSKFKLYLKSFYFSHSTDIQCAFDGDIEQSGASGW